MRVVTNQLASPSSFFCVRNRALLRRFSPRFVMPRALPCSGRRGWVDVIPRRHQRRRPTALRYPAVIFHRCLQSIDLPCTRLVPNRSSDTEQTNRDHQMGSRAPDHLHAGSDREVSRKAHQSKLRKKRCMTMTRRTLTCRWMLARGGSRKSNFIKLYFVLKHANFLSYSL